MADTEQPDSLPTTLSGWLGQLGTEVGALAVLAQCGQVDRGGRQFAARALRYWAHCIELPIEGIEDLRLLDIALVLRTLADFSGGGEPSLGSAKSPAPEHSISIPDHGPPNAAEPTLAADSSELPPSAEVLGLVEKLRADAARVRELLGEDYGTLARYTSRWVEQYCEPLEAPIPPVEGAGLEQRARQWSSQYQPPPCPVDANALIKVQAFARARYAEA